MSLRAQRSFALGLLLFFSLALVGHYLATSHRVAGGHFLPLDDGYIYLTYARQIARGAPFTYFDGSGYSAGATSALWPWVLAPLWGLGMRDDSFALASLVAGGLLYVGVLLLSFRLARRIAPDGMPWSSSFIAPILVCGSGPLAWGCLSGMEVGLVAFLLMATSALLFARSDTALRDDGPGRALMIALAALALSRPEAACVALACCAGRAGISMMARRWRATASWLVPLVPFGAWITANRFAAGHFAPNTAIAKSPLYLPGFTWENHVAGTLARVADFVGALFTRWDGPLGAGPLVGVLGVVGAFAILRSPTLRSHRTASIFVIAAAPVQACTVLFSSDSWAFQHQRYVSGTYALPLVVAAAGALYLVRAFASLPQRAVLATLSVVTLIRAAPRHRDEALLLAQGARDVRDHVVRVGRFVDRALPVDARIAAHDVGALGYYGHRPIFDVIGLITSAQAEWCIQGPGARFESLERIPSAMRPTHFAYYPGWLLSGSPDFFGDVLLEAPLSPPLTLAESVQPRLVGGASMLVMRATWELAGSGDRPTSPHPGFRVVDAIDVADLTSEAEHHYVADLGAVRVGDRGDRFSVYFRGRDASSVAGDEAPATIADGGRTILGAGGERFVVRTPTRGRLRIVLRSGGPTALARSEIGEGERSIDLFDAEGRGLGSVELAAPDDRFVEVAFALPPDPSRAPTTTFAVKARVNGRPYRSFHYFVLEEE